MPPKGLPLAWIGCCCGRPPPPKGLVLAWMVCCWGRIALPKGFALAAISFGCGRDPRVGGLMPPCGGPAEAEKSPAGGSPAEAEGDGCALGGALGGALVKALAAGLGGKPPAGVGGGDGLVVSERSEAGTGTAEGPGAGGAKNGVPEAASTGAAAAGPANDGPSAAEDTGGDTTVGGDTAGGDTVGEGTTGGDTAVGEGTTGGDTAGGDSAGGDTAGGDTVGGDTADGDAVGTDTVGADTAGGDSAGGDSVGGETAWPAIMWPRPWLPSCETLGARAATAELVSTWCGSAACAGEQGGSCANLLSTADITLSEEPPLPIHSKISFVASSISSSIALRSCWKARISAESLAMP